MMVLRRNIPKVSPDMEEDADVDMNREMTIIIVWPKVLLPKRANICKHWSSKSKRKKTAKGKKRKSKHATKRKWKRKLKNLITLDPVNVAVVEIRSEVC